MRTLHMAIDGGALHAITIESLGEIVLGDYSGENERLVVLAPVAVLLDDGGLGSYCFTQAVGVRGVLSHSDDVLEQVSLFERVAEWLRDGRAVTVASWGGERAPVMAALVLVASGRTALDAVAEVNRVAPGSIVEPDDEIPVSVLAERLRAQARRR